MLAILNSLNAHNLPIFQPILMILVSKFMVHRALSDKAYLSLGLLPPLNIVKKNFYKSGQQKQILYMHSLNKKANMQVQQYMC